MVVWTDNIPDAGHTPANDQPLMENNYTYLATDLAVDHNFTKNSATAQDGYHKVIHFVVQGGDPAPIAVTGQLYTKSKTLGGQTDQVLFFEGGGGRISQLSTFSGFGNQFNLAANPGFASVGPIMVNWGQTNLAGGNVAHDTNTVNFAQAFPTACVGVQVSLIPNTAAQTSSNNTLSVVSVALGSFVYLYNGAGTTFYPSFYWWAYGF